MALTVWKYKFNLIDGFTVAVPEGATILLVECQGQQPTMWCLVNTANPLELRTFVLSGTGRPVPPDVVHIASFQEPPFVWHIFEKVTS